ncbi:MAG: hypothetical protein SV375_17715 [Thermodesulfobacteriota bacterium]|nr:hypothetical protein [Thermodesulfobacteriota bacterium]
MMERQTRLAAPINKHLSFGTDIAWKKIPQAGKNEWPDQGGRPEKEYS